MDNGIDFSLDYRQLLAERRRFLDDLIAKYQTERSQINSILGEDITVIEQTPITKFLEKSPPELMDKSIVSQSIIKPLVIDFLSSHDGKHTTDEIFNYIKTKVDVNKKPRKSWVTGISLTLHALSKGKSPKVIKTDTNNNNIKEYEWLVDLG